MINEDNKAFVGNFTNSVQLSGLISSKPLIKKTTGHKMVHYSKVMNPKLVHYITENMSDKQREAALYNFLVWETFDLKNEE